MEAGAAIIEQAPPPAVYAINERGVQIRHSDEEVDAALQVLILCGGVLKRAAKILKEEGLTMNRDTLRDWRDRQFPRRFAEIRHRLAPEISENVAGRALERAQEADEAQRKYIREAVAKIDEVSPDHLAKNAKALGDAAAQNVGVAQLLRDRPTSISKDKTVEDLLGTLERLKVLRVDEPETLEGEAVEQTAP